MQQPDYRIILRSTVKIPVLFLFLFFLSNCIDPYFPELGNYQSLLVVEGLVTDSDSPSSVRLTRTFQSVDSLPGEVPDAVVYITDENNARTDLQHSANGIYLSDASSGFKGIAGKTYTLHIETADGRKYLSKPYTMLSAPPIDSVFYEREVILDEETGINQAGIKISLSSDKDADEDVFLRWEYEETWKFRLPSPKYYEYLNDSEIIQLNDVKEFCWKTGKSDEILINSVIMGINYSQNVPLLFIPPEASDRLSVRYSIKVTQFSVSPEEYEFWNNLKKINEAGGNIYDTQPYSVISNIYNADDPDEKILGYFKVSSVRGKRIYITPDEFQGMDLPVYKYTCNEFVVSPEDYRPFFELKPMPTWDELYEMFMSASGLVFVRPVYIAQTEELSKLVFAQEECSDCTLSGSIDPPDFWVDK